MTEELSIPLALHEDNVTAYYARDPENGARVPDEALDRLVAAMRTAHGEADRILNLSKALRGDPTRTPDAAALALRENALKAGERAARALDAAREGVVAAVARLEADTAAPPQPTGAGVLESEIRATLRGMSEKDRSAAIAEAFADGDDLVIGAAIRGPALLTGLDKARHGMFQGRWRKERHPAETDRVERLRKAIAALDRAGENLVQFTNKAATTQQALLAENAAARTQAALAQMAAE